MANTATVAKAANNGMSEVIDALRSVETESERWQLADALAKQIPSGLTGFDKILDAAKQAGIRGNLSVSTLRQYRDSSIRWPVKDRVPNVSFTAHKEAQNAGSTADAKRVLEGIMRANAKAGTGVTVSEVRAAISAKKPKSGKGGRSTPKSSTPAPPAKAAEIVNDLVMNEGKLLISAIPNDTSLAQLNKLIAGLKKVLGHAERLQMKATSKANVAAPATKVTPIKRAPVPTKRVAAGNLKGL